jgi:hypothetical protein
VKSPNSRARLASFGIIGYQMLNGEYILYMWNKGYVTLWPCQKMNYENSNYFTMKRYNFQKNPLLMYLKANEE